MLFALGRQRADGHFPKRCRRHADAPQRRVRDVLYYTPLSVTATKDDPITAFWMFENV